MAALRRVKLSKNKCTKNAPCHRGDSGKRGEARAPFGAECGKTSNLQLYRVSTFRRDGPGKKSRTNSHRLAEWPQFRCNTSWCIDLCATMQRARVFSSLLYQDVMVLDVPEKDPAQPCKKTLVPTKPAELHTHRQQFSGCGHAARNRTKVTHVRN